jgi:hypothetical protein
LPDFNPALVNFLFGCARGLGVTLYSLRQASRLQKDERPSFDTVQVLLAVRLVLLGGIVALANHLTKPISAHTALNVALSVPALIKS